MIVLQICYAGINIISKLAMQSGMNPLVLLTYRQIFGTLAIAPFAFFTERYPYPYIFIYIYIFSSHYIYPCFFILSLLWVSFFFVYFFEERSSKKNKKSIFLGLLACIYGHCSYTTFFVCLLVKIHVISSRKQKVYLFMYYLYILFGAGKPGQRLLLQF